MKKVLLRTICSISLLAVLLSAFATGNPFENGPFSFGAPDVAKAKTDATFTKPVLNREKKRSADISEISQKARNIVITGEKQLRTEGVPPPSITPSTTTCPEGTAITTYSGASIDSFVVPSGVTLLRIKAIGASGGDVATLSYYGGKGAIMKGTFPVTPGEKLYIITGQKGSNQPASGFYGAAGGGGTFVARKSGVNTAATNFANIFSDNVDLLVAAGGGGGGGRASVGNVANYNDNDANTGLDGYYGNTSGTGAPGAGLSVGMGGMGGGTTGSASGGGAGFFSDGALGSPTSNRGGKRPANGATGGIHSGSGTDGGFGGGGALRAGSGGGGGYSGGGGGSALSAGNAYFGGGGGSYMIWSATGRDSTKSTGTSDGNGTVVFTWDIACATTPATALNFDGVNDKVTVNNTTLGNFGTGDFTIEMSVRTALSTGVEYLASKRNSCGGDNFWSLQIVNGKLNMEMADSPTPPDHYVALVGNTFISDGNWHHVALTRQLGNVNIYVDGVLETSSNATIANLSNNYALEFGSSVCNGQNGSVKFRGDMDEIRIWNRALCTAELDHYRHCEITLPQTNLQAYYKLNAGNINANNAGIITAVDETGANNATLSSFGLTGTTSNWVAGTVSGTCTPYTTAAQPIAGTATVCVGSTTQLTNPSGGGTWTTSNENVATVNLTSGLVTGVAAGSVTITYTSLCGAVSTLLVTVNPLNTIAVGSNQTVCINSAITNITLATTGATGATVTGLPAGVTGSWSGNVVTISGTPTESGSFNYTVTTTGGCPDRTATGTITVNRLNTIGAGSDQTVCIASAITNITIATSGATGALVTGLPAGVTGSWSADVVTISGTPTASGTFNYTVTTTGGCPPATATGTITVTPLNTIAAGSNQTVCVNSAITNITLATANATGATITGLPAGVTGSWASNVFTIGGTPTESGTFNYTVTTTGGTCTQATASGTITVNPLPTTPTISANGSLSFCTGGSVQLSSSAGSGNVWSTGATTQSITVLTAGTYTVTLTNGCGSVSASANVTVNSYPVVAKITGNPKACPTSTIQLSDATAGGVWSSGSPTVATVNSSGLVSTLTTGTAVISYTVTQNGCSTAKTLTVVVSPVTLAMSSKATCQDGANGTATASAAGGGGGGNPASNFYGISESYSGGEQLVIIDKSNGAVTKIGNPSGHNSIDGYARGIAANSSGEIYSVRWGSNTLSRLYKMNPLTSQGTFITPGAVNTCGTISGLAFTADDQLYGVDNSCGNIYLINTTNGSFTQVGTTGLSLEGISFDPTNGILYGVTGNGNLYTISLADNGATHPLIVNIGLTSVNDIAFDTQGQLYATAGGANTNFYSVNKITGASTLIANLNFANNNNGTNNQSIYGIGVGSSVYSYLWSNGQTTATATGLAAGTYTVTATDANGCTATSSVTVVSNPLPNAPASGGNQSRCGPGNVTLSATPGSGEVIDWYSAAAGGTLLQSGSNTYIVSTSTIVYAEARNSTTGCISATRTAVTSTVNSLVTPTFTQVAAICSGASLSALPTTSTNNITGTWSPALNSAATTTYTFTPNAGQCANTATMTITVNPLPTATISGGGNPCQNSSSPLVTFTGANGTAPYTFTYTINSATPQTVVSSGNTVTVAVPTNVVGTLTYALISVKDASSTACVNAASGSAGFAIRLLPLISSFSGSTSICSGTSTTLTAISTNNPSSGFRWYDAASGGLLLFTGATYTTPVLTANTTYYVEAYSIYGCTSPTRTAVTVTVNAMVTPTFTQVAAICSGTSLSALPTTSNDNITGTWSPALNNTATTTYTFTPNAGQCATTATMTITVNALPAPTVTVHNDCGISSLTASGYTGSLLWSTGATGSVIVSFTPGTFTVTQTLNGCTSAAGSGTVVPNTPPPAPTVTVTNNCDGTSIFTASNYTGTLIWSTGETTPSITVNTFGSRVVQQTVAGCNSAAASGFADPKTASVAPTISVVDNCNGTSTLTASAYTGSLLWSTGATTSSITVNTAGTYTVTTTVSGCTSAAGSGIAAPNTAPNAPTSGGDQSRCGAGNLTLSATPGAGQTIDWYSAASGGTLLQSGSSTYIVSSATNVYAEARNTTTGCVSTTRTAVSSTINSVVTPTFTQVATICSGASLSALPTTSNNGITGTWSPALNNTATTTYTFTPNAGPCATTATMTITVNPLPNVTASTINPICVGEIIELFSSPGSSYSWTGPNGFVSTDHNPVILNAQVANAGTYTVVVTDANGCSASATATSIVNALPVINAGSSSPVCEGSALNLTSNGGVSYIWNGPNGFNSTDQNPVLNNVTLAASGTYFVKGTGANGCRNDASVVVTITPKTTPTFNQVAAICRGEVLSALPTSSREGIPGTWSPALNNLATTTYTFTPDEGQCATTATMTITVNPLPNATASNNGPACSGGSVQLNASGGVSYLWSGPNGFTSTSSNTGIGGITLSWAGVYSVVVTDANGCKSTATTTVVVNTLAPISGNDNVCVGSTTTLTGSGTPAGVNPWWSTNQSVATVNSAGVVTGVAPGNTLIIYTNSNGCTVNMGFQVNALPVVNILPNGPIAFCAGGSMELNANTEPGLTYSWTGGSTGSSITVTTSGTYTLTGTNAGGCASSASVTVTVNPLPPTPTISGNTSFCQGGSTILTSSSATGNLWSNGPNTQSITVFGPGTFTVTVTDGNDCHATSAPVTVTVNPKPVITFTQINSKCFGWNTGSIDVTVTSGTAPYTYSWSNNATTQDVNNLSPGTYTLNVTDAAGCTASTSVTITEPLTAVFSTYGASDPTCFGAADGNFTINGSGGNPPYTYALNYSNSYQASPTFTGLVAGVYYVTVKDAVGCEFTRGIVLTDPVQLQPFNVTGGGAYCAGSGGLLPVGLSGSQGGVYYQLVKTGTGNVGAPVFGNGSAIAFGNFPAGTYTVLAFRVFNVNCNLNMTGSAVITQTALPAALAYTSTYNCDGSVNLTAKNQDNSPLTGTILWSPNNETTATILVTTAGVYNAIQTINGCQSNNAPITVTPLAPPSVFTVGSGGSYCTGSSGVSITLSGSETGVQYYLMNSGLVIVNTISGTGSPISFNNVTAAGPYTIRAQRTLINCTVDMAGSASVTINTPPAIVTCPTDKIVDAGANCVATVNYGVGISSGSPAASVNYTFTGATTGSGVGTGSGATFNKGTTTVTITVSNTCGTVTCSFTVTVVDNAAPVMSDCPSNITVNTGLGRTTCDQVVTWTAPTATDNCGVTSITSNHNSGDVFPVGTTTVTYTFKDAANNTSTCSFDVTVVDNTAPVVSNCPTDVTVYTNDGRITCDKIAGWSEPTATDNCGGTVSVSSNYHSGDLFPVGTTLVTYTFTDSHNNQSFCSFNVIVIDNTLPVITCPANIVVNADAGNCSSVQNWSMPIATDNCGGTVTVVQIGGLPSGSAYPIGISWISFRAIDSHGNDQTCSFSIKVIDNQAPVTAPVLANVTGECSATAQIATAIDNCDETIYGTTTDDLSYTTQGDHIIHWTFTDSYGNTSTAIQHVIVHDVTSPVAHCPADISVPVSMINGGGQSGALVSYVGTATDNCSATVSYSIAPGSFFPVGTTPVTVTATDIAGNIHTCTFNVTVNCVVPTPTITPDGPTSFCQGGSVLLTSSSVTGNHWSTGETTQSITVNATGSYSVTVTEGSCSLTSNLTYVQVNPYPVITLAGTTCLDGSVLTFTATNATQVQWMLNGNPFNVNSGISASGVVVAGGNGPGSADNQLTSGGGITDVFVDPAGNVYVTDQNNHRIMKWAPNATTGVAVAGGNGQGSDANQLNNPSRAIVDAAGNVYVTDWFNHRVQKWAPNATSGVTIAGGNGIGSALNQTTYPVGVIPNADGSVYVLEEGYPPYPARVTKWAPNATEGELVFSTQQGNGAGQILFAENMVMDQAGNFILNDPYLSRVLKFAPDGNSNVLGQVVAGGNGNGTDANQTSGVGSMLIDAADNLYFSEFYGDGRITKWAPGATSGITLLQGAQNGDLSMFSGGGFGIDAAGNFYLGDSYRARVLKFTNAASNSYTPTEAGTYTVTVTSNAGCSTTSNPVVVNALPVAVITAAGPTTACPGNTVTLNASSGDTYQWYKDGVIIADATNSSFDATTSGSYTVVITSNGCTSAVSDAVVVTIHDITPPVTPSLPTITAQCSATAPVATTTDNCAGTINGTTTDALTYTTQGDYVIHWTFTDPSGNKSYADQHVIIRDITPPVAVCPGNISVPASTTNGSGQSGAIVTYTATVTDNCGATLSYSQASGTFFPVGTTTVTVTATDVAGNKHTCSFDVTVTCVIATPTITAGGPTTFCPGRFVVLTSSSITGNRWSTGAVTQSITVNASGSYSVTVTDATTNCSATSAATVVTVEDVTPPATPVLPTIEAQCSATAPAATTTDNCVGTVTGTTADALTYTTQGDHIIHWTFTDPSGNKSYADQHVIIHDVTPPVPACPATITRTATSTVDGYGAYVTYAATATDNCGVQSITYSPVSGNFFAPGTHTVTVTVTDVNGLINTCTFEVIVNQQVIDAINDDYTGTEINGAQGGTTPVVLTNDLLNNASFDISQVNLTMISNGGITGLTFDATGALIVPAGTFEGIYSVEYRICEKANPTNCDNAIVLIKVGRGLQVTAYAYCNNDVPYVHYKVVPNFTPSTASPVSLTWLNGDNTVVTAQPVANGLALEGDILWPGAVLDINGNPIDWPGWYISNGVWVQGADGFEGTRPNANLKISVNPEVSISISYPPATPGCSVTPINRPPVAVNDIITTEKCNSVTISVLNNDSDFEHGTLTLSVPSTTSAHGGTVTVNPDGTITYVSASGYIGTDVFTYTITDPAGLTASATVTVNVEDHTSPVTPVLSVVNGECSASAGVATTVDPCGGTITGTTNDALAYTTQGDHIIHWTFRDASGNSTTADQHVIVKDVTAPVAHCPANISVAASTTNGHGQSGALVSYTATATDNCGATVSYSIEPGSFFPVGTTTVTVTATDVAGNKHTCTFDVTVTCVIATPTISASGPTSFCPSGSVILTSSSATGNHWSTGEATQSITVNASGSYSVTVTDATTNCSATSAATVVTVQDVTPPTIVCPAPVTVQCASAVPAVNIASVTATDNCSVVVSHVSDVISNQTALNKFTITRTYKATDPSGNSVTCTQIITVNDNTAPTLIVANSLPGNSTGQCLAGVPGAPSTSSIEALYTDNCTGTITAVLSSTTTTGSNATGWTRKYFYTVTDASGNSTIACVTYSGRDTQAPVSNVATLPTVTAQCGATVTPPTATDNCAGTITATTGNPLTYNAQGTYTITWTYSDGNGNTSTQTQTVIVKDVTPPVINCPSDITVTASTVVSGTSGANVNYTVTATDNCGVPTITYSQASGSFFPVGTTTVTATANDGNGNTTSCSFKVTVGCVSFTTSITSVKTSNVYTGANIPSTTLFIGYGAQSTTLQTSAPAGTYTYAWSGASVSMLSSTTSANPVFTPTAGGNYTFNVTVTNAVGCSSTASITICVTDIRVFASVNTNSSNCGHQSHSSYNCPHQGHNHPCSHGSHSSYNCPDGDNNNCSHQSHSSYNCPHQGHSHNCSHGSHSSYNCPDNSGNNNCGHQSHNSYNCPHQGHGHSCSHGSHSSYNCPDNGENHNCSHQSHSSGNCPHQDHGHSCSHQSHSSSNCPDKDDDDDHQTMCNHQSHSSYECPHKGHNHYCSHRSHSSYSCSHRGTNDRDDDDEKDCDHKSHSSGDCSHKGHNHASCNHQSHSSYNCPHHKDNASQQTVCNHQSHSSSDCSHNGHNHNTCNHKSHSASDCVHNNNGGNGGCDDDDEDDDKKVYICHVPPGNPGNPLTLNISINAVASHLANHPGDRLGSCSQTPCTGYTDTEKPVIDCPDNKAVTYGSSTLPAATGSPEADDNSGDVIITYSDVSTKGANAATASFYNYTITRTWKAADLAGNFSTCPQIITVTETVKPVITCPPAITVACGSTAPATTGNASATDNASPVIITYTDAVSGNTTTRTWKATDAAGNYATCTQTITVIDNVKPVINCVADVTVPCNGSSAPAATGTATATDNCSTPVVTYSDVTNGNIITRTWKATDAAGNYSTCVQMITVPVTTIVNPNQICFISPTASLANIVNAKSTWTVNSSAQTVTIRTTFAKTFVDNTYGTNAIGWGTRGHTFSDLTGSDKLQLALYDGTGTKKLEFVMDYLTAFSAAPSGYKSLGVTGGEGSMVLGSSSSVVKVVTSMDENLNALGYNLTTNSPATNSSYAPNTSYSNWIYDVWYEVTVSLNAFGTSGFGKPGVVSVHASPSKTGNNTEPVIETSCGTGAVVSVMNVPADITVNCGSSVDPSVTGRATAINPCGVFVITYNDAVSGSVITRTWKITDALGNYATDTQVITFVDNVKPTITVPANSTISCGASTAPSSTGGSATGTDNCSSVTVSYADVTSGNVITRTWKTTDASGNFNTGIQTITIVDNVKPVISDVSDITVSCGSSTTPSGCGSVATATDNCSTPIVTFSDVTSGNKITRTWKATDAAGNFSTSTQIITIVDNTKPVLTEPNDITVACGSSTLPAVTGNASATDNCSAVTIDYTDAINGNKITRTWKATDASGNYVTDTQVITINDAVKPVITDVADITLNCGGSTLPANTGTPTATDNCSAPTLTYSDATSGSVITRTWKATDAAGNYSTSKQTITVGSSFTASLTSVPSSSTYTGGVSTNLYLGYGAQTTTLQMCALPSAGAPYTYAWSGSYTNKLNSTSTAAPLFTPTTFGYYTFSVTVTNKFGCTSVATISICVTDIRVAGTSGSGAKVYMCHTPSGYNKTSQTIQVLVSQVPSHLGSSSCGSDGNDRLGTCGQSPCNTTVLNAIVGTTLNATKEGGETVATSEEELKVTAMPNPSTTYFTLKIESKYETPVSMRVMDGRGRVIDAKSKIGANSTIQIGHNYSSGTYYAELIQGTKRKVVQLIKGKG